MACLLYSARDQTVRFAYVTSLRVEGKQTHIICEPQTLPLSELRQRATKYCRWEIMFVVWTVYAFLSATPLIPLPFISNGCETHTFAPITVPLGDIALKSYTEYDALTSDGETLRVYVYC
jgi:hypothetical protein